MSGIVGIVNLDGRPVDPALLERMTASLDFRGPDARQVWVDGAVGFGHTLLRTTFEAKHETQPLSFDGETWIVADCRVDAREELVAKLHAKGRRAAALDCPDVELVLHAWHVWGEACVEHLLGDFAFAIWDAPNRRLFCARDHMGLKLFYYARRGATVVFSNTLDCVRMHPDVTERLNDLAIADFLMFDMNQDPETTSFADVMRIPAAHAMRSDAQDQAVRRYWSLPVDEPVYFKRASDYTDRFIELLDRAVADRLRTDKVGVFMSGGLDSTTLAATASKLQRARSPTGEVHAFTIVMDELDGGERAFAQAAADHLQIPIRLQDLGEDLDDATWARSLTSTPEPYPDPTRLEADRAQGQKLAGLARVWFYGEGPDNALWYEWWPYLKWLMMKGRPVQLGLDVARHVASHRRIPLLPTVPRMLASRRNDKRWIESFPAWLSTSLEVNLGLRARFDEFSPFPYSRQHPIRPGAHGSFALRNWDALTHRLDAEFTRASYEVRQPFLALPILRFMLAVPPLPWCRDKLLLRRAMRGVLPPSILERRKTPLSASTRSRSCPTPMPRIAASPLSKYVNWALFRGDEGYNDSDFRPIALGYWFRAAFESSPGPGDGEEDDVRPEGPRQ